MRSRIVSFTIPGISFYYSGSSSDPDDDPSSTKITKTKFGRLLVTVTIFFFAFCLSGVSVASTHPDAVDSLIVQARTLVDSGYSEWKKDDMLHGYALLQRAAVIAPDNKYVQYYLAYAGYRIMTYGMAMKQENIYKEFADRTEKTAEDLDEKYGDWSEPKVLLASIYGIEIAHSWMNGATLGPKSSKLAEEALAEDSTNPRAYLILGTNKYSTPGIFGGSVDKAVEYFKKSIALFAAAGDGSSQSLAPRWGYIDALTWLGLAYEKQARYSDALDAYKVALSADPNYSRAKYVLIPEVQKKIAGAK